MKITLKVEGYRDEPPLELVFTEAMVNNNPMIAFKAGELWGYYMEATE